jgi:hypothetical protein
MTRNRAQLWVSLGGCAVFFVAILISDALGLWILGWGFCIATAAFAAGRVLWILVDLRYLKREIAQDRRDWELLEHELARVREDRQRHWQALLDEDPG